MLGLGVLWILAVLAVDIARSLAFARRVQSGQPAGDLYVVFLHLPGGLWTLLGPPVLLAAARLAMQRSRPAS